MNQIDFKKLYKDVTASQEKARQGLREVMVREPLPMFRLAPKIGISGITIKKFLAGAEIRFPQLVKICQFIIDEEKRLGVER
jgi:predicted transcriptional regulator